MYIVKAPLHTQGSGGKFARVRTQTTEICSLLISCIVTVGGALFFELGIRLECKFTETI